MATFTFDIDGTPTNADSVKFSNPTGSYGLRRVDTLAVVINDGVNWVNDDVGEYSYDLSALQEGLTYDYWIEYTWTVGPQTFTQRVQRFISGTNPDEVLEQVTLRFCGINADGDYISFEETPVLENPTDSYGVMRTDDLSVIASPGTEFNDVGTLWSVNFQEPEENLTYLYTIKATVPGTDGSTYYLSRNSSYVKSAALVFGRYCNSTQIEQRFGVENLHTWLAVSAGDESVDYAKKMWDEIVCAEEEIDDYLRSTLAVPLTSVPNAIRDIAVDLAACRLYESRGVVDYNQDTGAPSHRLGYAKKRALDKLKAIRSGKYRLAIDETIRYPRFEETVIPSPGLDDSRWDNWS